MTQKRPQDLKEITEYDVLYNLHRLHWIQKQCPKNKKIVDIGGNDGHTFYGYDKSLVTTVDLDVYDIPNFVRANAEDLPFTNQEFDIAVLAEILEHVEDPKKAIQEALRVAKKLIITVPYEHYWPDQARPFHFFEKIVEESNGDLLSEAVKGNPACKEFYTDDNHKHLFHHRFFTPESLEVLLKDSTDKEYYMIILENEGMPCIGVIVE